MKVVPEESNGEVEISPAPGSDLAGTRDYL
jgi:hypothetical protein